MCKVFLSGNFNPHGVYSVSYTHLYALNGGVDVKTREQVGPAYRPVAGEVLDYDEVIAAYDRMMDWLAGLYVNTLNLIQYMHDKYYYEAAEMALIDTDVRRTFATGIAGFSHVVDSLSAIKYAKVTPIRDETGLIVDFKTEGDFPRYGNDDDRADDIAVWLLGKFLEKKMCIRDRGGDVVVFLGLCNQRAHGLFDGKMAANGDEVRAHRAADFVRLIGADEADIMLRLRVELFHQRAAQFRGDGFQRVHGVVRIHRFHDIGGLLLRQFAQIFTRIADIGEHVAKPFRTDQAVELCALMGIDVYKRQARI